MKTKAFPLLTAFSLIMSAITAPSAPPQPVTTQAAKATTISVSYLPFYINAPGVYVLTGDLTYTSTNTANPAISINGYTAGGVILDLKGFTITSAFTPDFSGAGIYIGVGTGQYPITIRNGAITNFGVGIFGRVPNITVNNVVFNQNTVGVDWDSSSNSTIKNCQFNGPNNQDLTYGIVDRNPSGGNTYDNNTFINIVQILSVFGDGINTRVALDRCHFAPSPSK